MGIHWTERLFIENAYLTGPSLEGRLEDAVDEVRGLKCIFSEHGVPEGTTVLDMACGVGRHSLALAKEGYRAVGVDISPTFIERAGELAEERGVADNVDFRVGDIRDLGGLKEDYGEGFDAVVNLLTSHGYWDRATDRQIFRGALEVAKPGGVLVIHTVNRDYLVRNFREKDWSPIQEGRFMLIERRLDLEESRMYNTWRYYEQRGEDLVHLSTVEVDHLVYSLHELKEQVEAGGWEAVSWYGGYGMQPLTTDSFVTVLVARKPT